MSSLRLGIIGFGGFAQRSIAPAIQSASNATLVALQKRSRDEALAKARLFNVPYAFDSVDQLIRHPEVDAVFITSANSAHAAEAIAAAHAGKHVLVEKPIATSCTEAEQMIEACDRAGVRLMVGHMVRLSPAVRKMKQSLQAGKIGTITFVKSEFTYDARLSARRWLFDRTVAGGGPLFDIAVHCLDTIRFLLDDEVVSVKAHLDPLPTATTTESTAMLSLRFTRGTLASIFTSYTAGIRRSLLEVVGTEGTLSLERFTRSGIPLELVTILPTGEKNESETQREAIIVPDLYREEVELFAASILNGTESPIPGVEGLKNQRVLDQALRSATQ